MLVLALWGLLLVALAGCGAASRAVRLETGEGKVLVVTPRGGEPPVQLREGEFKASLAELVREVRPAAHPLQHARRLMLDAVWHEDVYLRWTGQRLELDSEGEVAQRAAQECLGLTHDYGRWCENQRRPRDCLSLLTEGPVLDADGRYALAMELALGAVWNEAREAFKDMANPEAVRATLVSAMAMYLMLWVLPEPVSKGVAASLTAGLIVYLGVDTVWSLIQGWRVLVAEADRATSFAETARGGRAVWPGDGEELGARLPPADDGGDREHGGAGGEGAGTARCLTGGGAGGVPGGLPVGRGGAGAVRGRVRRRGLHHCPGAGRGGHVGAGSGRWGALFRKDVRLHLQERGHREVQYVGITDDIARRALSSSGKRASPSKLS